METLTFYTINNSNFEGTFQGDWSILWQDLDLTDKDEAIALYEREIASDWDASLEKYRKDEVTITLNECTIPYEIDEDGDIEYFFNEQDSDILREVTITRDGVLK